MQPCRSQHWQPTSLSVLLPTHICELTHAPTLHSYIPVHVRAHIHRQAEVIDKGTHTRNQKHNVMTSTTELMHMEIHGHLTQKQHREHFIITVHMRYNICYNLKCVSAHTSLFIRQGKVGSICFIYLAIKEYILYIL